jgi:hypothetical protein
MVRAAHMLGILFIAAAGCSKGKIIPGVNYTICVLTKGNSGKVEQQDSVSRAGSAVAGDEREVGDEGSKFLVRVRKTQYGKATFEVTFPDSSIQLVQVRTGERTDILPKGKAVGVRIEVQDSH